MELLSPVLESINVPVDLVFKNITRENLPEILDVLIRIGRDADVHPWLRHNYEYDLPGKWDFSFFASLSGQVLGYVIVSIKPANSLHIHHIAIDEHYRGLGYGPSLLDEVERRAIKAGADAVTLKVNSNLPSLVEFYKRNSFKYARQEGEYLLLVRGVQER